LSGATQQPRRRRRRTADEARRAILEAAQKRLAEWGPEEVRLQDIAADLGISHPAILHHFGSREGLMLALSRYAFDALNADLVAALSSDRRDDGEGTFWLDRVFETLRDRGHARLLAWSLLTGRIGGAEPGPAEGSRHNLLELAKAVHERRRGQGTGADEVPLEHSVFAVQLVAAALLGDALMGPVLRRSAGLSSDEGSEERYRVWLGERVTELLSPPS